MGKILPGNLDGRCTIVSLWLRAQPKIFSQRKNNCSRTILCPRKVEEDSMTIFRGRFFFCAKLFKI